MTPELGQVAAALWELAAVAFLVGVALAVRKAKARSQRLFVDGPTERAKSLHADTRYDHTMDGF
jgi:hypothetical protein